MHYYTYIDVLRFVCISGMVIFDCVGLVLRHMSNVGNVTGRPMEESSREVWLLNVGGISTTNPISGLNIPIFVILAGIIGGYIRYLYKAATKQDVSEAIKKGEHSIVPIRFVHETFQEISEIALSGLLAIIVWFLISQGSINTNVYMLGAISLTVGLVTREIVASLKNFAMRISHLPDEPTRK